MISIDEKSLNTSLSYFDSMVYSSDKREIAKMHEFEFHPFQIKNHSNRIAAVDGSNNTIYGINFLVGMLRAGHLMYQDGRLIEEDVSPIKLETLVNSTDELYGYHRIYQNYFYALTKEHPDKVVEFEKVAERLRTLMEWKYISNLIERLSFGDVIIFDGSLISGAISTNHLFFGELVSKARDSGITLMGLSKDTSLSIESVPVPAVLKGLEEENKINSNWYVKVDLENEEEEKEGEPSPEETYFVKFSKEKDLIFRCDAVCPEGIEFKDALSKVGAYAYDERTFGYPFPMQRIHDKVRISEMEREQSFEILKNRWLKKQKVSTHYDMQKAITKFEKMFAIYHNQLDIISSGR